METMPGSSYEEEDLVQCSTKKVKTLKESEMEMVKVIDGSAMVVENQAVNPSVDAALTGKKTCSYKDSLLKPVKMDDNDISVDMDDDSPNYEDQWYREQEEKTEEDDFDMCPNIPVSKEEFDKWCKPWQASVAVKVLGKHVSMGMLEFKLK